MIARVSSMEVRFLLSVTKQMTKMLFYTLQYKLNMIVHFEIWEGKIQVVRRRSLSFSFLLDSVISRNKDKDQLEMTHQKEKDILFNCGKSLRMTESNNLEDLGGENAKLFNKKFVIVSRVKESRARIGNEIEIRKNSDSHGPLPWTLLQTTR